MSDVSYAVTMQRREKVRVARRVKQFNAILTTAAYAVAAGSIWEPLFKGRPMTLPFVIFGLGAVAMFAISVYIAPLGEVDDRGHQ